MPAYVDSLKAQGWKLRGRDTLSCHLIADTAIELHAVAEAIGMKRKWFQGPPSKRCLPHYDLTAKRRAQALELGAQALERRPFVTKLRAVRYRLERGEW